MVVGAGNGDEETELRDVQEIELTEIVRERWGAG